MDRVAEAKTQEDVLKMISASLPEGAGILRDYLALPSVLEFGWAPVDRCIAHMVDVQFPNIVVGMEWAVEFTPNDNAVIIGGAPPAGLPVTFTFSLLGFLLERFRKASAQVVVVPVSTDGPER